MTESCLNLELRHIEVSKLTKLSAIIDKARAWRELISELTQSVPSHLVGQIQPLDLSLEAIDLIEQQYNCGKSPTLACLNYWSISGRRRPTVRILLEYLRACKLRWAEDYVNEAILGIKLRIRPNLSPSQPTTPYQITAPPVSQSDDLYVSDEFMFHNLKEIINNLDKQCVRYSFKSIYESTNGFCHRPYDYNTHLGTKVGDGRFSSVFRAQTFPLRRDHVHYSDEKRVVAAKLLKSDCDAKYLANEINLASKIRHDNILELLGVSLGFDESSPTSICLIYPYMQNGSLFNCLHLGIPCWSLRHLNYLERIAVACKVSAGIQYLHSYHENPIIHRDIKTANILIDIDLEPKIGDFTLIRQLDCARNTATQLSQNIIGTSVYMPPEAFRGDISTKFDVFSFGIVIFELLTGFKPFNEDLGQDLFTYITEKLSDIDDKDENDQMNSKDAFLREILDKRAGAWDFGASRVLFDIALQATESRKKARPEMSDITSTLESLCNH